MSKRDSPILEGPDLRLAIDTVRERGSSVALCAGPGKCDSWACICPFCYVVQPDDPRTPFEILADMEKRNRVQ